MDRLERSIDRLRHPTPGSRIEAERESGVDLDLLIANLRLTPAERVSKMHEACVAAETDTRCRSPPLMNLIQADDKLGPMSGKLLTR